MVQLAWCLLLIVFLCIEFGVYGVAASKIFRFRLRGYETGILGFFVYFGLFQTAALPLILLQRPFHQLVWLWLAVLAAVNIFVLTAARKDLAVWIRSLPAGIWRCKGLLLAAVAALILFACWFQATQQYMGWDTTFYIGTVDTTVYTDAMYVYDGVSGIMEKALNMRYAMSAFYVHSAFLCKVTAVSGIMVQKYVIGTLCILIHGWIVFAIGRRLFPQREKMALALTGWVFVMHFGFQTIYTVSDFLLIRGYEAKGYCANVVIPAVFYAALCIWEEYEKPQHWAVLFALCFSSVPVSMSSLVIVPAMVVILTLTEAVVRKSWKVLWRGFWCAAPNGIYLIIYFLYTQGFKIMIQG